MTMKQLTVNEFKAFVARDPAWALTLTEPVEITGCCNMARSKITHLSPLLHFAGRNKDGDCANFSNCMNLKVAEGSFAGFVNFCGSGVEKIGDLRITAPDSGGVAGCFDGCLSLKVAEGTFPGSVSFDCSCIERIGTLITVPDAEGKSANFNRCEDLKVAEGSFAGFVNFGESGVEKIGALNITAYDQDGYAASFADCPKLKVAEGIFPGYVGFSNSGIERIQGLVIHSCNKDNIAADFSDCTLLQRAPVSLLEDSSYQFDDAFRLRAAEMQAVRKSVCTALQNQPDLEI